MLSLIFSLKVPLLSPHLIDPIPMLHQRLLSYLPPPPGEVQPLLLRTHTEFPLRSSRKNSINFTYKCFPMLLRRKLFNKLITAILKICFYSFSWFVCTLMGFSHRVSYHALFSHLISLRQNSSAFKWREG